MDGESAAVPLPTMDAVEQAERLIVSAWQAGVHDGLVLERVVVPLDVLRGLIAAARPAIARSEDTVAGDVVHHVALPEFVPEERRLLSFTVSRRVVRDRDYDEIEAHVDRKLWQQAAQTVMHSLGWPKP